VGLAILLNRSTGGKKKKGKNDRVREEGSTESGGRTTLATRLKVDQIKCNQTMRTNVAGLVDEELHSFEKRKQSQKGDEHWWSWITIQTLGRTIPFQSSI
jgi:hypothetical protein